MSTTLPQAFVTTPKSSAARQSSPPLLGARTAQRPTASRTLFDRRSAVKAAENALTREVRAAEIQREIEQGSFYCAQWMGMGFHDTVDRLPADVLQHSVDDATLNAQFVEQARALNLTVQRMMLRASTVRAVSLATAHNKEHDHNYDQFQKKRIAMGNFQHFLREAAAQPAGTEQPLLDAFELLREPFIKS